MSLRKSSRRAPLTLQTLERRENPAGNVVTSMAGGVLTLTGTDEAETFTIKNGATAGTYVLTGTGLTTIDGAANVTTLAATSVKMVLNGGDDTVAADTGFPLTITGALTINGGDGANTVNFTTTASPVTLTSLAYTGGEGFDSLFIGQGTTAGAASTVAGAVAFTPGNGGSDLQLTNTTVGGEVTDKAGVGDDIITLTQLTANKSVAADLSYGDGTLSASLNTVIAGGLSYKALDGADDVTLNAVAVNGAAGVTVAGGIGDANLTTSNTVSVPAGGLSVAATNGFSDIVLAGTLTLLGDFKVNNLSADVSNGAAVTAANVSLVTGDSFFVSTSGSGAWTVKKNLTLSASSPVGVSFGSSTFNNLNLDGTLTATATQSLTVQVNSGTVKGAATVTSKTGGATLQQVGAGNVQYQKGVTVKGFTQGRVRFDATGTAGVTGDVSATAVIGNADFRHNTGAGAMTLGGAIKLSGYSAFATFNGAGAATVAKDVTLTAKAGSAAVTANGADVTLSGKLTATGSVDASLGGSATGIFNVLKDVSVKATYRDAAVTFGSGGGNTTFGGKLTVAGGNGATVSAANTGAITASLFSVAGDLAVMGTRGLANLFTTGDGKTFTGNVALKGYQVVANVNTDSATTFAKTFTATGGAGDDTILMGIRYNVAGDATFNLGGGSSAVILSSTTVGVDFGGNLTVTTGNDQDTMTFVNVQAAKAVSVTSLAGNDVVSVDDGSVFTGAFTADVGAGNDIIDLGRQAGLTGPTVAATFTGKATIKAGAGNDTLFLGRSVADGGDTQSVAVFGTAGSTIDGGTGFNAYDDENGQGLATTNLALSLFTDPN